MDVLEVCYILQNSSQKRIEKRNGDIFNIQDKEIKLVPNQPASLQRDEDSKTKLG